MEDFQTNNNVQTDGASKDKSEGNSSNSETLAKGLPVGILCCAIAALLYTGANGAMTTLSRIGTSEIWFVGVKESITVLTMGPLAIILLILRPANRPDRVTWAMLIVAGLLTQLLANIGYAYSLKVIGMAATIPIISASVLTSTAILGRYMLDERLSIRTLLSIALLIVAICFISGGSGRTVEPATGKYLLPPNEWLAVLTSVIAGLCFGFLTISIRYAMNRNTQKPIVMTMITLPGLVCLIPAALYREGLELLGRTSFVEWKWMLGAGVLNLIAFYFLNKGLELTRAIHANITTSSQIAMAAILGLLWFNEPFTAWLVIGVLMTVAGVLLIGGEEGEML